MRFKKNFLFVFSIIVPAPLLLLISCSSQNNSIENNLLNDELNKNIVLLNKKDINLNNINLLDLVENNSQLENIFELPEEQTLIKDDAEYRLWYSWDFIERNIVTFEQDGSITFEVSINCKEKGSNQFTTISKNFQILIEETTIEEENSDSVLVSVKAFRYFYQDLKFQAIREDVFEKSLKFNKDFYSSDSLIYNRPVIIEDGAEDWSSIDAQSSKNLVKAPNQTRMNDTQYSFSLEQSDFNELNPHQGIYKIVVTPTTDVIFNSNVINYANKQGVFFKKTYYYYELNTRFEYPTQNNISSHNQRNTQKLDIIAKQIEGNSTIFKPYLKSNILITNETAMEIVKLNNETPGGIFSISEFYQEYSIEPYKPVKLSIESVSAKETNLTELTFSITITVGHENFLVKKSVNKILTINQLISG